MKLVFVDQTGCHAALVAANYLIGRLERQAGRQDIIELPAFAEPVEQTSKLREIGLDVSGNSVYTLGVGSEVALIKTASWDLLKILRVREKVLLLDFSRFNRWWHVILGQRTLSPRLVGMCKSMAAKSIEANRKELWAELAVKLKEAGLEYSNLDLIGDDQG